MGPEELRVGALLPQAGSNERRATNAPTTPAPNSGGTRELCQQRRQRAGRRPAAGDRWLRLPTGGRRSTARLRSARRVTPVPQLHGRPARRLAQGRTHGSAERLDVEHAAQHDLHRRCLRSCASRLLLEIARVRFAA